MENELSSEATPFTRPRLYGIVHIYVQNQLPPDIHPAFKALRDREEKATLRPQIGLTEEPAMTPTTEREVEPQQVQSNPTKDDDDDNVSLYAVPQGNLHAVVDLMKRRSVQRCCD